MERVVLILGAADPEMEMIERLAREAGCAVGYATHRGQRVRPETAYQADGVEGINLHEACDRAGLIVVVECAPAPGCEDWAWQRTGLVPGLEDQIDCAAVVLRIDHHRPGDPGYGRPPAEFLPASSLGQVISILAQRGMLGEVFAWPSGEVGEYPSDLPAGKFGIGEYYTGQVYRDHRGREYPDYATEWLVGSPTGPLAVPDEYVLAAAADHCLAAAYRGECPGVDPDELMRWRAESRARFQRRTVEDVLADVERAREALRTAPVIELAPGVTARDMRGRTVPELPEAAAREGVCFIGTQHLPDGRVKVVHQCGAPYQIRAFMEQWAPAQGLVDVYGDPARGFAGGYIPKKEV
jgi:hypothetical protein